MSHISQYAQTIKNVPAFLDVAKKNGCKVRTGDGTVVVEQFGNNKVEAVAGIMFPGWKYEVAIKADGTLHYDHFGSEAESFDRLGEVVQAHNVTQVMQALPHADLANYYTQTKDSGDRVLVLEYD